MEGRGNFKCDYYPPGPACNNKFKDKYNLTRHQVVAHKAFPPPDAHPCAQCNKTFTREDNLKLHMKRHTAVQQFSCSDCTKIYASRFKLKLHKAKAHEDGETPVFKCSHCEHKSEDKWNLGQHMLRHTGKWAFSCDNCRYKTSTKINLAKHVDLKHTHPRNAFFCDQCAYSSPLEHRIITHSRKHEDIRSFSCLYCDQTFKHKYQLPIHVRSHSGERLLHCEPCDKVFLTKQLLKQHKKSVSHRLDPEQQVQRLRLFQELKEFTSKMKRLRGDEYLVKMEWKEKGKTKEKKLLVGSNCRLLALLETFPVRHQDGNWENRGGEQVFEPTMAQAKSQDRAFNALMMIFHPDRCSDQWKQENDFEGKYVSVLNDVVKDITGRKTTLKDYCQILKNIEKYGK